jgi:hypothetical protein
MLLVQLSPSKFIKVNLLALNFIKQLFPQMMHFSIKQKVKIPRPSLQPNTLPILRPSYYVHTSPITRTSERSLRTFYKAMLNSEIKASLTSPLGSHSLYFSAISYASLSVFKALHVVKIIIHRTPHSRDYQFQFHRRQTKIRTLDEGKQTGLIEVTFQKYEPQILTAHMEELSLVLRT